MTTIVADKRHCVIAGDRLTTDRGLKGYVTKVGKVLVSYGSCEAEDLKGECEVHILERGIHVIYGIAGSVEYYRPFINWLKSGMDISHRATFTDQSNAESFQALVLCCDGRMFQVENHCMPMLVEEDFYAIGSGNVAGIAAMLCGKNAEEAVEIACQVDIWSGGGVDTIALKL